MDLTFINSLNLDTQRNVGDHEADYLIKSLIESKSPEYYQYLIKYFTDYSDLEFNHEESLISDFLRKTPIYLIFFQKKIS